MKTLRAVYEIQKKQPATWDDGKTCFDDYIKWLEDNLQAYINQEGDKVDSLNGLLIKCANFIQPFDDGDGEATKLMNEIDIITKCTT